MNIIVYISLVFTTLIFSCSNGKHATDKSSELLYIATSDSLNKYLDVSSVKAIIEEDSTILDYTTLDYSSFRSKYSLGIQEMDQMAETFTVTYQIASAFKSLEDNMQLFEFEEFESLRILDSTDYSFNKVMPIDTSIIIEGDTSNSNLIRILMEAYDTERDSLK
ncbi:MAG: hypothetical protein P8P74_07820 [Crocinitomicaceae bacterium]|nr:hypothetical protein [Crocinitomicaceae bacterium]